MENDFEDDLCPRCKCCSTGWQTCWSCGGDGGRDGEDLMEEDPLWYSLNDWENCDECGGKGGWNQCLGNCDEDGKHDELDTR
jgi:hypothetical protein